MNFWAEQTPREENTNSNGMEGAHLDLLQPAPVEQIDGHARQAAQALLRACAAAGVEVCAVTGHALSSHRLCAEPRGGTCVAVHAQPFSTLSVTVLCTVLCPEG